MNITFLAIFWFNIQPTKILENLNLIFNGLKLLFKVGLSMGWAGSVLDPTPTWLASIRWRAEEPGLDPPEKSIESVSGEGEGWSGWVGYRNKESIEIWNKKASLESGKFAGFWKKSPDSGNISSDFAFSR